MSFIRSCGAYFAPNGTDPSGLAGYFFDGTANSRYTPNDQDNLPTNVTRLWNGYIDGAKFYVPGVGSGYNADGTKGVGPSPYELSTGSSTWGNSIRDRADYMITLLEGQLESGDKIVDLFGFSRGAATATLFLNKIQKRMECNPELYEGIRFRYVGLYDQVPSDMGIAHQSIGRSLDTLGWLVSFSFWSPNVYARNANNSGFSLPKGMKFEVQPLHLIAMDEKRKEFAGSDLVGARQVGFAGVHSDVGGSYGGFMEYITLNYFIEDQASQGLHLFNRDAVLGLVPGESGATMSSKYDYFYRLRKEGRLDDFIRSSFHRTDNSSALYNDNENRYLPPSMTIDPSYYWFNH